MIIGGRVIDFIRGITACFITNIAGFYDTVAFLKSVKCNTCRNRNQYFPAFSYECFPPRNREASS